MVYVPPLLPDYNPPPRQAAAFNPGPSPEAIELINNELGEAPQTEPKPETKQAEHTIKPGQPRRRVLMGKISAKDYRYTPDDVRLKLL